MLDADKTYEALVKLGQTTDTGDLEGKTLTNCSVQVRRQDVEAVLARFLGKIGQVPPMHSALKHRGKPLYAYARAGLDVERQSREVTIHHLRLLSLTEDELQLQVACSKGTYIRVLAQDIGRELGCGGCLKALRRTGSGSFELSRAVTLAELEAMDEAERLAVLRPEDVLLSELPRIVLDDETASAVNRGRPVPLPGLAVPGPVRLYDREERFLGLGEVHASGLLTPKRLMAAVKPADAVASADE